MNINQEKINLIADIYLNRVVREIVSMNSPLIKKKALEVLRRLGKPINKQSIESTSKQIYLKLFRG